MNVLYVYHEIDWWTQATFENANCYLYAVNHFLLSSDY
jgi:hypothetical protein